MRARLRLYVRIGAGREAKGVTGTRAWVMQETDGTARAFMVKFESALPGYVG